VVEELLLYGADPNVADNAGYTPLAFAACSGSREVLSALLRHGAQPDPQDTFGVTPLMQAATRGNADLVGVLLQAGAQVLVADADGRTAVDYAEAGDIWDLLAQMQSHAGEAGGGGGLGDGGGGGGDGSLTMRALAKAEEALTYRGFMADSPRITPRVPTATKCEAPMTPRGGSHTPRATLPAVGVMPMPQQDLSVEKLVAGFSADPRSLAYLTKKLCNLTVLLQHDTMNADSSYPRAVAGY